MIHSDDFVAIVPTDGLPFLAGTGDDLSEYVGERYLRVNKTVTLRDGREIRGSVFRARKTTAADEIHLMDLIKQRFGQ